ncbi:hypothetical protein GK047_21605 [Paenibacillus sp. SYP-B3998]|uniref:Uncharacterized protein n=1 Tax=Paenibacillus sp. SYP-B3998 TaxID=2678564 RepID=A0A6G4A4M1_9BACL|nr:hypothetical protein [Paenibacillus sp. SYP-B3998]NEW08597.1 hypothetical protein [Paenibacillus sp. SYP-B3998]
MQFAIIYKIQQVIKFPALNAIEESIEILKSYKLSFSQKMILALELEKIKKKNAIKRMAEGTTEKEYGHI